MKKVIIIFSLSFLFNSCTKNPERYIEHLEGYWEIERVTLANGRKKEYSINETIDFIELNDSLKGFRKKMKPRFDGKFETSTDVELLELKIENSTLYINYATHYATWTETVLMANSTQLQIMNQNNDVYLYKRFTPIHLE